MRRIDASMSLLSDLADQAMEPDYLTTTYPRRSRWILPITAVLVAALLAVAAISATRSRSEVADERADLLARIAEAQQRRDTLQANVAQLDAQIRQLRLANVGDETLLTELERMELATGAGAVTGPGVVIVVDDAPQVVDGKGLIYDSDLTRLVAGLWQAGAEAIAINGHRVTTLTPIRSAGAAITVDYVSLKTPYTIEAIGDPDRLPGRFANTAAAQWWRYIQENYGISYHVATATDLELSADPGMVLRFAEK